MFSSVLSVYCMFFCGWSVVCFLLDNALSGCMCAWYRLNASKPCFGRISFTRFIELVAFFPREVSIVSVSSFLVGLVGYTFRRDPYLVFVA